MWRPSTPSLMRSSPTPFQRSPAGFRAVGHFTALPVSSDTGRGRSSSQAAALNPLFPRQPQRRLSLQSGLRPGWGIGQGRTRHQTTPRSPAGTSTPGQGRHRQAPLALWPSLTCPQHAPPGQASGCHSAVSVCDGRLWDGARAPWSGVRQRSGHSLDVV